MLRQATMGAITLAVPVVLVIASASRATSLGTRWTGTIDYHLVSTETDAGNENFDGKKTVLDLTAHWTFDQPPPPPHGPEDPTEDDNAVGHVTASGTYHDETIPTTTAVTCDQARDDATGSTMFRDVLTIRREKAGTRLELGEEDVYPYNHDKRQLKLNGTTVPYFASCRQYAFTTGYEFPQLIYLSGPGITRTTTAIRGSETIIRDCFTDNPEFPLPGDSCRSPEPGALARDIHQVFTVTVDLHPTAKPAAAPANPRAKPRRTAPRPSGQSALPKAPIIVGPLRVGTFASISFPGWTQSERAHAKYNWSRCVVRGPIRDCKDIGAHGPRYRLTAADAGKRLWLVVTTAVNGRLIAFESALSAPVRR